MSSGGGSSGPAPLSPEEVQLTRVNTELARKQLENVNQLQPFQKELLELTMADLRRSGVESAALNAAITPEQRAAQAKAEFERTQRLGPIQDELLQLQLEQLRQGGRATPEQLALIKEATERGIEAGSADIDISTKRGIGLISDELANSRGLRLTDSPIMNEAGFLARAGAEQKASLIKNLRAGEATAALNYPLGVQQIQSGINLNQQGVMQNAQQFQTQLRQQAYQNRLALMGTTANTGIGLASVGGRTGLPSRGQVSQTSGGTDLAGIGAVAAGVAALWPYAAAAFSDRRLKKDYGVVGKTDHGINLHLYHYKGEDERDPLRLGVMADEVRKVKPEAVHRHPSGFDIVNYARL